MVVSHPPALGPAEETAVVAAAAPIEYTVAVDRYLDQAALSVASRRVYRISLIGWAWPLVGKPVPSGAERRRRDAAAGAASAPRRPRHGRPTGRRGGEAGGA